MDMYHLIQQIKRDEDTAYWQERWEAAEQLAQFGTASLPVFLELLHDPDFYTRGIAAYSLGLLGDQRAVEPLISALGDESGAVRFHAVESLGLLGNPQAIPALTPLLDDTDHNIRDYVAWALNVLRANTDAN